MGILTVILGLASKLLDLFFPSRSAEKVARDDGVIAGQDHQIAAENASAAHTEAAMSQAITDAPKDKTAVLDALNKGQA